MTNSSEDLAQLRVLREVRNRHHQRLIAGGTAERILSADVEANYLVRLVDEPVTEGTLFYATRQKLGNMAMGMLWGGTHTISSSCRGLPSDFGDLMTFVLETPATDLVVLSRLDGKPNGMGYSTNFANVGLHLPANDATRLGVDRLIPLDGIERADLAELAAMVDELEVLRTSGELSRLSEEGLINNTLPNSSPYPLP